jgi:hypothetical protein
VLFSDVFWTALADNQDVWSAFQVVNSGFGATRTPTAGIQQQLRDNGSRAGDGLANETETGTTGLDGIARGWENSR